MSTYDIESALRAKGGDVEEAFKLLSLYSRNEIVAKAGNEVIDLTSSVDESLSETEAILSDQTPKENDSGNNSESDEMPSPKVFELTAPTQDMQDPEESQQQQQDPKRKKANTPSPKESQQQRQQPQLKRARFRSPETMKASLEAKESQQQPPPKRANFPLPKTMGARSVRTIKQPVFGKPTKILDPGATREVLQGRKQPNVQIFPYQQQRQQSPRRESSQGVSSPQQSSKRSQMTAKYLIERKLGAGSYGEAFRVRNTANNQLFALKIFKTKRAGSVLAAFKEYSVLFRAQSKTLLHEHVVETKGYFAKGLQDNLQNADLFDQENDHPMILYNLIEGQSLAQRIGAAFLSKNPVRKSQLWFDMHWIAYQLLGGLTYLHAKGIMHRDIKSDNIMIESQPGGGQRVVIIDLGLSCVKFTENDDFKKEDEIHCDLPHFAKVAGVFEFTSPDLAQSYLANIRIDQDEKFKELKKEEREKMFDKIPRRTLEANDVYAAALTLLSMVVEKPQHILLPQLEATIKQYPNDNKETTFRGKREAIFKEIADSNYRTIQPQTPDEQEIIKYYFRDRVFGERNSLQAKVDQFHLGFEEKNGERDRNLWSVALMSVYKAMSILVDYNQPDFTAIKSRNKIHEFWEQEETSKRSFKYDLEGKII